ncbi:response regulator [Sulfitobacter guttiformis]|uniref:Response regulator receiver domain-containing protein n=1 Tax=Sulfitobacter guttiformis TaxID=74349 RepID=A0A420DTD4_9RHOB|nr:response regulator [Sulfitobacter guttiformis]KIN71073.1 Response regulator receiver domain protein [Sulfitobacter guttiformis KCTC 32187]RKE97556.1 response regulator receiver domain-containing protein [Sulfitobacter guttiformis]
MAVSGTVVLELLMRILAIDDDPVILELLEASLCSADGFDLATHPSAESALDALEGSRTPFDCILLDIMLPGIDGIEMCELLRKTAEYRSVPILMITGCTEENLMARAFNVGATDFLMKPLNQLELIARVKSAGLLNRSLRTAHHSMGELSRLLKVSFDAPVSLSGDGMTNMLALENRFLRCKTQRFAMTLFDLDICGLRGIYRSVGATAFRQCLELIAEAAGYATAGLNVEMAYVGNGRFFGCSFDRKRINFETHTAEFNKKLGEIWDSEGTGVPTPPTGKFRQTSEQRIWSGTSACNQLQALKSGGGRFPHFLISDEVDLFSRFDTKINATS